MPEEWGFDPVGFPFPANRAAGNNFPGLVIVDGMQKKNQHLKEVEVRRKKKKEVVYAGLLYQASNS